MNGASPRRGSLSDLASGGRTGAAAAVVVAEDLDLILLATSPAIPLPAPACWCNINWCCARGSLRHLGGLLRVRLFLSVAASYSGPHLLCLYGSKVM